MLFVSNLKLDDKSSNQVCMPSIVSALLLIFEAMLSQASEELPAALGDKLPPQMFCYIASTNADQL